MVQPGQNITTTIYARFNGNDQTGKGTLAKPYRTFARAILDVAPAIPPGNRYIIDITAIGVETLAQDWACPPIVCSQEHLWNFLGLDPTSPPYFSFVTPLTVRAIPRFVSGVTPNQIGSGAGATVASVGPNLVKVTVPGATWAPGALKGFFAVKTLSPGGIPGFGGGAGAQTIFDNTATELFLTTTVLDFNTVAGPLNLQPGEVLAIMEPSATLQAPPADNFQKEPIEFGGLDAINFQGIHFQNVTANVGGGSVLVNTVANPGFELCVLDEATLQGCRGLGSFISACTVRGLFDAYDDAGFAQKCYFQGVGTSVGFPSFRMYGQGYAFFDTVFEGCSSFGGGQPDIFGDTILLPMALQFANCWLRGSLGDALTIRASTRVDMQTVQIDNSAGHAVSVTGPCQVTMSGVTGSGNTGYGLRTDDGAHAQVDAATTVGNADGRAYSNGAAAPVAAWPGAAFNSADATTFSRVWEP